MSEKSTTNDPTITNPKDAIGSNKVPLHLWPETATVLGSMALLDGALKYGRSNYRAIGVRATIYADAAKRHINRWLEGRDNDTDSGLPELAHALACLAILVDAAAGGKLNDDRLYPGGYHDLIDEMTPHVARLKEKYADKSPKHYTIADEKLDLTPAAPKSSTGWLCACGEEETFSDEKWVASAVRDEPSFRPLCANLDCGQEMERVQ